MTIVHSVTVEGRTCPVTVSDEREALLAALAAGGAVVGIIGKKGEDLPEGLRYLCTDPEDLPEKYLERVARRHLSLPWVMARTERLIIREFTDSDPLEEANPHDGDGVFSDREKRRAYIESQYGIAECGLWALVRKADGRIVGKCGLNDGELAYHIYPEFRGQGLALEACRAVIRLAFSEEEMEALYLRVREENKASLALAKKLGFEEICCQNGVIRMGLYGNLYNSSF